MANSYIGEIRMFGGNFAPAGWAICDGSLMAISDNDALFALIGTTYGGDGQSTFALPDLRSRVPIHVGTGFTLGQNGGEETVGLTVNQIPAHSHAPRGNSAAGTQSGPGAGAWAVSTLGQFSAATPSVKMDAAALRPDGGSQPHDNMVPFLAVNFILSLFGVFPTT